MVAKIYPVFKDRNYRLYAFGQIVSFSGNWMQIVAISWLVHEITKSDFWTGLIMGLPYLVAASFTPFTSVIADRFDRKKVLQIIQVMGFLQALSLALLIFSGYADRWSIFALIFLTGLINSVDGPARSALVFEIFDDPSRIKEATAMNAALQTFCLVIGPALAGLLIWLGSLASISGEGLAVMVNAASFLPIIKALEMMRIKKTIKIAAGNHFEAFKSGFKFLARERELLICILLNGVLIMGFSFRAILPGMAKEVFVSDATGMSFLNAAMGLGACVGALAIGAKLKNSTPLKQFAIWGNVFASSALLLFSQTQSIYLGSFLLFLSGIGFLFGFIALRAEVAVILKKTPEQAGRVGGMLTMIVFAGMSAGNLLTGYLAQIFGFAFSLYVNAGILLFVVILIQFKVAPFSDKQF